LASVTTVLLVDAPDRVMVQAVLAIEGSVAGAH
jgi:hypothetical protein